MLLAGGIGSFNATLPGPLVVVSAVTIFFRPLSAAILGLPGSPAPLCMFALISMPSRVPSRMTCAKRSSHASLKNTGPLGVLLLPLSHRIAPPMPLAFIASRSCVIDCFVACPACQNHQARIRASCGISRNPSTRASYSISGFVENSADFDDPHKAANSTIPSIIHFFTFSFLHIRARMMFRLQAVYQD